MERSTTQRLITRKEVNLDEFDIIALIKKEYFPDEKVEIYLSSSGGMVYANCVSEKTEDVT